MSMFKGIEQRLSTLRRDLATPGIESSRLQQPVAEAIAAGLKETGRLDGAGVRRIIDATHTFLDQAKSQPLVVEKVVANSLREIKTHADKNLLVPLDASDPASKTQSLDEALAGLYTHTGQALTQIKEKPKAWGAAPKSFEIKRGDE